LFYEIGCMLIAQPTFGPGNERIVAFHLLQVFFATFGRTALWMPGLAVIIILLCTHAASRQPWTVRSRVIGLMYLESVLLAAPLMAFNHLLQATPVAAADNRELFADLVLGIGAGIYEELVFRLVLIALLVMVGGDLLKLSPRLTMGMAVTLSALAFSAHHHPPLGSEPFALHKFIFRTLAGVYLGLLFTFRGYGPAAGTHAAYNVLVTLLH
jgi:membrane protease YdiL (CAAX protease family)